MVVASNLKPYHLLELISFPYYLAILISATMNDSFYGIPLENWIGHFISSGIIAIILLLFIHWKYQLKDARARLTGHLGNAIFMAVTYGKVDEYTGVNDPSTNFFDLQFLFSYLVVFLPAVLVWLGAFTAIIKILEAWDEELENFVNKIHNGDYSARITSHELLNDLYFQRLSRLLNQMAEKNEVYIDNLQKIQSLINKAASQISQEIGGVSKAAEEITSTSDTMATSASIQAQHLSDLLQNIENNQILIAHILEEMSAKSSLIDQIAVQTNILSLNAGIEASRAGDYGRGFAVIAKNILSLSEQTQNTVNQINDTIANINENIQDMANGIKANVESIAAIAQEGAASAEEVAASSKEISNALKILDKIAKDLGGYIKQSESLF